MKAPSCDPSDFCIALRAESTLFMPEIAKSAGTPERFQHVSPFAFLPSSRTTLRSSSPLGTVRDTFASHGSCVMAFKLEAICGTDGIRRIIKDAHGVSAADLIDQLNPKIRGWANYHRHVVSKHTFGHVDRNIFSNLWQWARRRHPNKSPRWFKLKYFDRRGNRPAVLFTHDREP